MSRVAPGGKKVRTAFGAQLFDILRCCFRNSQGDGGSGGTLLACAIATEPGLTTSLTPFKSFKPRSAWHYCPAWWTLPWSRRTAVRSGWGSSGRGKGRGGTRSCVASPLTGSHEELGASFLFWPGPANACGEGAGAGQPWRTSKKWWRLLLQPTPTKSVACPPDIMLL